LLRNLATLIIPLFARRFNAIGSLYFGPNPKPNLASLTSGIPTPKTTTDAYTAFPFSPNLLSKFATPIARQTPTQSKPSIPTLRSISVHNFHVGPIISWPFFGSNRGELSHPNELNRGPWSSTSSYLTSCTTREITGVILENEGKTAPHKLHLDPAEIHSSRYHRLRKVEGDESDESDEWDLEESDEEDKWWEGPGDTMYRDYRRMQRSTFLISKLREREEMVRKEMARWFGLMEKLRESLKKDGEGEQEEFALDCHDLSLENIFVDQTDHTRVVRHLFFICPWFSLNFTVVDMYH
jgi:hypothetical protein